MATAQFAHRSATPNVFKSDLDMDTFFDFNQSTFTPPVDSRSKIRAGPSNQVNQQYQDEAEAFAGPSHEYDRFPQQTGVGVSVGDMNNLASLSHPMQGNIGGNFGGFNSGIDEGSFGMGWDMDADMNMDMGNVTFAGPSGNAKGKFVDPTYIDATEEPQSNVGRLWPGMHSQAALVKQQQQQQPPQSHNAKGKGKATGHADPHTEESISRLLNQMRHNSHLGSIDEDAASPSNGFSSGMSKMRKDEEDMDEDERLLASEEGKKLSSKERRQLRNKVSARAFRSRRKEYIGQLEGEIATRNQDVTTLKTENAALTEENARYRALIQTLLRHPSFTPFIEDISKDPAFIAAQAQVSQSVRRSQSVQAPTPSMQRRPSNAEHAVLHSQNQSYNSQPQPVSFDFSQPQFYNNSSVPTLDLSQPSQGSYF